MKELAQSFDPQERARHIGASEIACLMGRDSFKTPLQLFNQKTGREKPFTGNNHTARGNRLEQVAAEEYAILSGINIRRRRVPYTHKEYPFIRGHVDRVGDYGRRIIEIKCPTLASFRRHQQYGLPDRYLIQLQIYMGLSGIHQGTFVIFCADAWETIAFDVSFEQTIYDAGIKAAVEFWNNHIIPDIAPTETLEEYQQLDLGKVGGTLTIRDDDYFVAAAQKIREAKNILADAQLVYDSAESELLESVENLPGVYEGGGLRLHIIEVAGRKTFDKNALANAHPEIDLSKFEKTGKPSIQKRIYFPKGDNNA